MRGPAKSQVHTVIGGILSLHESRHEGHDVGAEPLGATVAKAISRLGVHGGGSDPVACGGTAREARDRIQELPYPLPLALGRRRVCRRSICCVIAGGSPQATRSDSLGLSKAANRRAAVKQYVGLDVSQKETAVCVVDENGKRSRPQASCYTGRSVGRH
jgi:hypothetical protein